ncbi:hypothetical protein [Nitrosospira multiformis]|uniref:Uncharacterized protein n=1 Tax=Nitrosospira multiformis TaxID=1231 RepID=A0A1I7HIL2_9PROT|nr:hypothetical protein [Nitrosospira multiformis]SFU60491.1 hypothetical protein SAMN05216417_109104 [Nitrosospira multiformis]
MVDTLKNYTFLPWLRQGLAAGINIPDNLGASTPSPERASIAVNFDVATQPATVSEPVSKTPQLLGPGDIVGINSRAIVKTEPRHFITDFESNYLPYIEFYEEDFPWRFTPASAVGNQDQLRPWIFLTVLTEDEFDEKGLVGPLPAFEIKADIDPGKVFPRHDETWAWAHVHISRNVIGSTLLRTEDQNQVRGVEQNLQNLLVENPDNASSRLLCPRKLKENTAYHAFVIPAFETGRRAGLGVTPVDPDADPEDVLGQQSSWEGGQRLIPIYYRWFFRTGTKGDFEFLVDLLEPREADKRVGVRDMDMQEPDYGTEGMLPDFDVIGLEGALRSTTMVSSPEQWPPAGTIFETPDPGSPGKFLNDLELNVNRQFNLQQQEPENGHPDPIVSPPLYGRWYAQAERLDVRNRAGWVDELNADPRLRTPAGAGTQVVQKDQENLMQQAWSQLGDLLRANQKIRQLQLGLMSSFVMYEKNVLPQSNDQLMVFTQLVQSRVMGSPMTIAKQVQESRLPQAALDPAFRKITRNRGAIMRKVAPEVRPVNRTIVSQLNEGNLTAAPKAPEPTGSILVDEVADTIDVQNLPEWLRRLIRNKNARLILMGVIAVALVLALITGTWSLFVPIIVVAIVLLPILETLRARIETAETFREKSFTPAFVDTVPARPNFVLTEFQQPMPRVSNPGNADSVEATNFRVALKDAYNIHQTLPPVPPERVPIGINASAAKLKEALNPSVAIPRRAEFVLKIPAVIKDSYLLPQKTLVTVMAHPVFTQPMYRPLRDISSEFLCPNLELVPNNTVSLLKTNQRFIEAYMVGLNHEMACELLWREFPTDQRGSYFRQFWDVGDVVNRDPTLSQSQFEESLLDIDKLHEWDPASSLGEHANRPLPAGGDAENSKLVLVVRGDVLKKYPTVVIYAQEGKWNEIEQGHFVRELDETKPILHPIFKAEIEPDIRFLGFDLTEAVAKGSPNPQDNNPGWFFVLQERPGEPRFGLDNLSPDSPATPTKWNDVAWEHLKNFETLDLINLEENEPIPAGMTDPTDEQFVWRRNAADMAYIFYQVPVMVAFHSDDMLR